VSTRPALFAGESLAKNIAYSIYGIINLIGLGLLMHLADSMPIQLHQFVRQHMDDVYVQKVEYILVFLFILDVCFTLIFLTCNLTNLIVF
jgi:hypothetical protein